MFETELAQQVAVIGLTAVAAVKGVTAYSAYKAGWHATAAACTMSLLFLATAGIAFGADAAWPYVQQIEWQELTEKFFSRPQYVGK